MEMSLICLYTYHYNSPQVRHVSPVLVAIPERSLEVRLLGSFWVRLDPLRLCEQLCVGLEEAGDFRVQF